MDRVFKGIVLLTASVMLLTLVLSVVAPGFVGDRIAAVVTAYHSNVRYGWQQ